MSQENIEVVQRSFEALSRRDCRSVVALADPDVEFFRGSHRPMTGRPPGTMGRANMASFAEAFESVPTDPSDASTWEIDEVVCNRFRAPGRHSGVEEDGAVLCKRSDSATARCCGPGLSVRGRSPRSRGAVGVGDVAGERGARARNFKALNARDLDALREQYDSNVIVRAAEDWPEPGALRRP